MAATYQPFVSTRTTTPDPVGLVAALRVAVAADVGVQVTDLTHYTLKKDGAWTAPQIAAAQTVLDTQAAQTPQLAAQRSVDAFPLEYKALVLALVDALNVVRAALPVPLPPITPAQAMTAIRNKAGTL